MEDIYTQYYSNQIGSGLGQIGPLYTNPRFIQHGRGGVGAFFSNLFHYVRPLLQSSFRAVKSQAIKTGKNILSEAGSKPIKEIIKQQGRLAVEELAEKGLAKLQKMQRGEGQTLKKCIKRKVLDIQPQSVQTSREPKRRKIKPLRKQGSRKQKKKKNLKKERDIFLD